MKRPLSKYRPLGPFVSENDDNDILDELRKELNSIGGSLDDVDENTDGEQTERIKDEVMDIPTPGYSKDMKVGDTELQHSYREHETLEYMQLVKNEYRRKNDPIEVADKIDTIEGQRYQDMLTSCHEFIYYIDEQSRKLFIQRNPDLVQWTIVYQAALENTEVLDYIDYWNDTVEAMTDDMSEASNPPPFESIGLSGQELYGYLQTCSKDYSVWNPRDIRSIKELMVEDKIDFDGYPYTASSKILKRVEFELMYYLAADVHRNFIPLDQDEIRIFANRNPGILMWADAYGVVEDLVPVNQIVDDYPTLETVSK